MTSRLPVILYGIKDEYVDVTSIAISECSFRERIYLPSGDHSRSQIFSDPVPGIRKQIKVIYGEKEYLFSHDVDVILTPDGPFSAEEKLKEIHSSLKFTGDIKKEYPEQIMSVMFIPENAKVLELGSNIGRNTLVIKSLLKTGKLVTVECDPNTCKALSGNIQANEFEIPIENAALSKRRLFQKAWVTYLEGEAPADAKEVKTISFEEIEKKHDLQFDTLVADCEGALYYILMDAPEILDRINLLIMENDYTNFSHKIKVDEIITSKGFSRIYVKGGGWGPCKNNFYEAWGKQDKPIEPIPFFIVSYNNGFFVNNTVEAIRRFAPLNPIFILDNASTSDETHTFLSTLEKMENVTVKRYIKNEGPWRVLRNPEWAQVRKKPFVLTDPDLDLTKLPLDTLQILEQVQHQHQSRQVGLALDISQKDDLIEGVYNQGKSIVDWEAMFWRRPIGKDLYLANIDTTFCLYNYRYPAKSIRVAGPLTVRHLPWHKSFIDSLPLSRVKETFDVSRISTTSRLIWSHLERKKRSAENNGPN